MEVKVNIELTEECSRCSGSGNVLDRHFRATGAECRECVGTGKTLTPLGRDFYAVVRRALKAEKLEAERV